MSQVPPLESPQESASERLLLLASEIDTSHAATAGRLREDREFLLAAGVLLPGLEPREYVSAMRLQEGGSCPAGDDDDDTTDDDTTGDDTWEGYPGGVSSGGDFGIFS